MRNMTYLLIILICFLLHSCDQTKKDQTKHQAGTKPIELNKANANIGWLLGKWKRLNDEEGKTTLENCKLKSQDNYKGHGFTMKGVDTVWQEKMTLTQTENNWVLEVKTPGNKDMVSFEMTDHSQHSFTVENPTHDFPKAIKYWKDNQHLKALVKADSMEIEFEFAPTNKAID